MNCKHINESYHTDSCVVCAAPWPPEAPQNHVEMITIPKSEYDKLCEDSEWLSCLEAAGVDNWDGFDEAINIRKEMEENDDVA